ncbi:PREDICTED: uncharacterized protein LOC109476175 [Branchiostoma belcheri]|uniref:Uncharacterized protein LOC109476175 n=1 Tax=Branchiostoma belcheri TaxID=7741 RepID=A0A6P4Z7K0_BRABE|nr:PREDICTED: uncharacterized protein LOC109476175 [Branchiostoma belcheri]
MSPPTLRTDASLVGHRLTPVLRRCKGDEALPSEEHRARFEPGTALAAYSRDDLETRVKELTASDPEELLDLAGLNPKEQSSLVRLAHFLILAANETMAAQPVDQTKTGRIAAQAAVGLLHEKPDAESGSNTKKRPTPPANDTPTPTKKAKAARPSAAAATTDSSDAESGEELEDEGAQAMQGALRKLKRICREPTIHAEPERLERALQKVIDTASSAKAKEYYEGVRGFFLKNTTSFGIGREVLKFVMTKQERRFAEEAERATAALRGGNRNAFYSHGRSRAPAAIWGPKAGPSHPPSRTWGPRRRPDARGWNHPRSHSAGKRSGDAQRTEECFNCNERGHWQRDCPHPKPYPRETRQDELRNDSNDWRLISAPETVIVYMPYVEGRIGRDLQFVSDEPVLRDSPDHPGNLGGA